ncbi:MAG: hypothetical protein GY794_08285 [bacterium]|nr:hypothetical protein [bacterium]
MKKFALVALVLFSAALLGYAKGPTTKPAEPPKLSLEEYLAEAKRFEEAGHYSQAAKSARAAMAIPRYKGVEVIAHIRKLLRRLAMRQQLARRLDAMAAVLVDRPDDLKVREKAIKICISELDNPARAAKFVNEDIDQILQTYVPMACRKITDLPEAPCRELAEWYINNLENQKVSNFGRVAMLKRVAAYYGRFLKLHKAEDTERTQADEKYQFVVGQLAELGEEPTQAPL